MNYQNDFRKSFGTDIDPVDDWITYLLMNRKKKTNTVVIVEGKTDEIVYANLLDLGRCEIESVPEGAGKAFVIMVMTRLTEQKKTKGIIAIVDEDYDSLKKVSPISENLPIFTTGVHDVECLLLNSKALNKFLKYLIPYDENDPSKSERTRKLSYKVQENLKTIGITLGLIRWSLQQGPVRGPLENFDKTQFILYNSEKNDFEIQEDRMINHIVENCLQNVHPTQKLKKKEELKAQFNELRNKNDNVVVWKVSQGHDLINILINILTIYLHAYNMTRKGVLQKMNIILDHYPNNNEWFVGKNNSEETRIEGEVINMLITCYEQDFFRKTELYKVLYAWENKPNNTYRVLQAIQ